MLDISFEDVFRLWFLFVNNKIENIKKIKITIMLKGCVMESFTKFPINILEKAKVKAYKWIGFNLINFSSRLFDNCEKAIE